MEYLLAFMSFKILVQVQYKFYTIQLYIGETYLRSKEALSFY